ncbi:MAG: hypothetical protein K1W16_16735 [Lachnospiraceae bacterium]|jgi:hypothetical protein
MEKQNRVCKIWKLLLVMVLGAFITAFSFGVHTAQAAETTVENTVQTDGSEDNGGGAMILLMGGMLIIILAVVLSVVGTFVSSAAIVDEL